MRLLANFGYDPSMILQEYVDEAKSIRKALNMICYKFNITRSEALNLSERETNEYFDLLKELTKDN